tara:strand:+ start:166 stop:633 length:468 start_codon:yes stop_codon:yes gene_type:complete
MKHFIGTYQCRADQKGRIMLPVSIKKQLSDKLKYGFVIKRAVFNPCLELYPQKEWDGLMVNVNKLNRFNKKNIDFIRRFTAGVRQIDIDISGRILIPKELIIHAKISKDVVVSSAVNIIEIWDKSLYENAIDDAKFDFGDLAEEVMGDKKDSDVS